MKKLLFIVSFLFILIFLVTYLTTFVVYSKTNFTTSPTEYYLSTTEYLWPLPDYHNISSYFGFRISPITGLPSNHSGIDIPAPARN